MKEVVNIQGLFVLTVGYVDKTTYPLTKYYYIIERVYFIYRLFILFITTFSFLMFFMYSIMEVKERLPPCQYRYFVLHYVLYYEHDEEILDPFIPRSYLRYKKGPDLDLPSRPVH